MTVKREYICNFCNGAHFDGAGIYGALWAHKDLRLLDKSKSENHLCKTCIEAIVRAHKELNNGV